MPVLPPDPQTFAEWKAAAGLTDQQIAERVSSIAGVPVSRVTINYLLRGERNAGGKVALALRELTGLPIEVFLNARAAAADAAPADKDSTEAA